MILYWSNKIVFLQVSINIRRRFLLYTRNPNTTINRKLMHITTVTSGTFPKPILRAKTFTFDFHQLLNFFELVWVWKSVDILLIVSVIPLSSRQPRRLKSYCICQIIWIILSLRKTLKIMLDFIGKTISWTMA